MVSTFSIIMAIVVFNLAMLAVAFGIDRTSWLVRYNVSALLIFALLSAVRLFLPLDFAGSQVINSYTLIPRALGVLEREAVPGVTLLALIGFVWLMGSAVMLAKQINAYALARSRILHYRPAPDTQAKRLLAELGASKAAVLVSADVATPHVIGITRAHIYLPAYDYTDDELRYILRHELTHFKSRDTLTKLFYMLLAIIFWWNPIVHWFQRKLDNLLELRCDTKLVAKLTEAEQLDYLDVLLKTAKAAQEHSDTEDHLISAFVKDDPGVLLKQRFDLILSNRPKKAKLYEALSICVAVMIFIASFFVIIQPAYEAPDFEEGVELFSITPENAYIVFEDGVYSIYVDDVFNGTASAEMVNGTFSFLEVIIR